MAHSHHCLATQKLQSTYFNVLYEYFIVGPNVRSHYGLRARETIELLSHATPDFISPDQWPPNNQDFNPLDYKIWGMPQCVYKTKIRDIKESKHRTCT